MSDPIEDLSRRIDDLQTQLNSLRQAEGPRPADIVKNQGGTVVDNQVARFDGVTGRLVQGASTTISDAGNVKVLAGSESWADGINIDSPNGVWGGIKFRTVGRTGIAGNWHIGYDATHGDATAVLHVYSGNVGYIASFFPAGGMAVYGLPVYASNAAAIAGGLSAGCLYRTNSDPDHLCIVH